MYVAIAGIVIVAVSVLGAVTWIRRHETARQNQAKVLLFALYFWLLVFIQLILAAIAYVVLTQ